MATLLLTTLAVFTALSFATESLFTGIADPIRARLRGGRVDWNLPCRTQLWGVLVYGLSATVSFPLVALYAPGFYHLPWIVRGLCYTAGIFAWEFHWGLLLELLLGTCPWEYADSPRMYRRFIKPAYAPFWFLFGFVLEWVWLHFIPALMSVM